MVIRNTLLFLTLFSAVWIFHNIYREKYKKGERNLNRNKKITIAVVVAILFIIGLLIVPCFYERGGRVTIFEQKEITMSEENDANLNLESQRRLAVEKASVERQSLLSIITERIEENSSSDNELADENYDTDKTEESELADSKNNHINNNTSNIEQENTNGDTEETLETPRDEKEEHDQKYANQFLTKDRGYSDEFFKNEENLPVILDFGKGAYDISDCVVKWAFGEPVVSLNKVSKKMGLELSIVTPDGFHKLTRAESYQPGDTPNLEYRYRYDIFLVSPQGSAIRYQTGSTIQEDNEFYYYLNVFQVEGDREKDYETLVTVSELPYYDGEVMKAGVPANYSYANNKITITMSDPGKSTGRPAITDVKEITEEEYKEKKKAERKVIASQANASKE